MMTSLAPRKLVTYPFQVQRRFPSSLSSTVLILQFEQRVGHGSNVLRVVPLSSSCGLIRSCDGPEMRE